MKKYLGLTLISSLLFFSGISQTAQFTLKMNGANTIELYFKPSANIGPVVTGISNATFVLQIPISYPNPQGNWVVVPNSTYLGSVSTTTQTSTLTGSKFNTLFSWSSNPNISATTFTGGTEYLLATVTTPVGVNLADVTLIDWGNNRLNNAVSGAPIWATSVAIDGSDKTNNASIFYLSASTTPPSNSGSTSVQSTLGLSVPLSIKLISFDGKINNNVSDLQWTVSNETTIDKYEVLYSIDAANWTAAGNVKSINTGNQAHTYYFSHNSHQLAGAIYYRLRIIPYGGAAEYSNVIRLSFNSANTGGYDIYPTMLSPGEAIHVVAPASSKDKRTVRITDANGKMIHQSSSSETSMEASTYTFAAGAYQLQVIEKGKVIATAKFVVN